MLNEDLQLTALPADVRRAFVGKIQRQPLPAGHELYKFTHHPLFKPDGTVTPWWSSVEPLTPEDPGLEGTLKRAADLGVAAAEFVRARTAVTRQWNRMSGLLVVRLLVTVVGFAGRCANQQMDDAPEFANVVFIGGAWQLYIPNLTQREIVLSA
jgi:hypothetical protein